MADEYIRRDFALAGTELYKYGEMEIEAVSADHIQRIPAADVVPVVRCKDCKHRTEFGNCGHPRQKGVLPSAYPFDFCSYGEPKKGK